MNKRATFSNSWLAAALLLPQLLLVFIFFYWPSGEALWWSFTLERPFGGGNEWVGFYNYLSVLQDSRYWGSVRVSVIFAIAASALSILLALMLAVFVDRRMRGHQILKTGFFLPYALAAPAVGLAFRFIFAPDAGLIAGINRVFPGLWNPALDGNDALTLIILAQAWSLVGYNFIFFLAGLQSIPRALLEAGAMDGAGPLRRVWDLQLPLLAPTLFFLLVINITDSFVNSFGIVDIVTSGGPARATELMVYKVYTDGFQGKDSSLAATQSVILMVLIMALTFVQFRFIERKVHYN
ncbi:ABC transporter permease subunit [Shinella daejeonensis]|uniref:carbohydrate ABC transporter permease n=1 Tax=Shinella daejeonensis TaxID=659017 RepID=UPI0020C78F20|nr:ABC transporter permease subunit [Shinella daejeonensis]MCP8896493.1 ABC transporter permease subunit [Shinella daejeonensis]